jgi:hypothetical protein
MRDQKSRRGVGLGGPTDVALDKLGARAISAEEAEQLLRNRHVMVGNRRGGGEPDKRLLPIGRTDRQQSIGRTDGGLPTPRPGWSSPAGDRHAERSVA